MRHLLVLASLLMVWVRPSSASANGQADPLVIESEGVRFTVKARVVQFDPGWGIVPVVGWGVELTVLVVAIDKAVHSIDPDPFVLFGRVSRVGGPGYGFGYLPPRGARWRQRIDPGAPLTFRRTCPGGERSIMEGERLELRVEIASVEGTEGSYTESMRSVVELDARGPGEPRIEVRPAP
jgi:hypothetical protein